MEEKELRALVGVISLEKKYERWVNNNILIVHKHGVPGWFAAVVLCIAMDSLVNFDVIYSKLIGSNSDDRIFSLKVTTETSNLLTTVSLPLYPRTENRS